MLIGSRSKDFIDDQIRKRHGVLTNVHSVGLYDLNNRCFFSVLRGKGEISPDIYDFDESVYKIVFVTSKRTFFTQPAELYKNDQMEYLWLQGSFSFAELEKMHYKTFAIIPDTWDVRCFLRYIQDNKVPSGVDGTFACVYTNGDNIFMFRNEYEQLHCDKDLNFCSDPFEESVCIPPNKVFFVDFDDNKLIKTQEFETFRIIGVRDATN